VEAHRVARRRGSHIFFSSVSYSSFSSSLFSLLFSVLTSVQDLKGINNVFLKNEENRSNQNSVDLEVYIDATVGEIDYCSVRYTRGGQNNGNTKKWRNRICVGYIERTSVGNVECFSSVCLHSVMLV
jgi:hypothetical protein